MSRAAVTPVAPFASLTTPSPPTQVDPIAPDGFNSAATRAFPSMALSSFFWLPCVLACALSSLALPLHTLDPGEAEALLGVARAEDDDGAAGYPSSYAPVQLKLSLFALAAASALGYAALFLQVALALDRASGVSVRESFVHSVTRLARSAPLSFIAVVGFALAVADIVMLGYDGPLSPPAAPLFFVVGIVTLPMLTRTSSTRAALRRTCLLLRARPLPLTLFVAAGCFSVTTLIGVLLLVFCPLAQEPVAFAVAALFCCACGAAMSTMLVALTRAFLAQPAEVADSSRAARN